MMSLADLMSATLKAYMDSSRHQGTGLLTWGRGLLAAALPPVLFLKFHQFQQFFLLLIDEAA